jgi:hypothetical protein
MEEEHDGIDPLLISVAEGFAALAGDRTPADGEDLRAALAVRMAATRDLLDRHLAHEETDAIAILQRHCTQDSWQAVEEQIGARKPPVPMPFMVGWCAEGVPRAQLDEAFGIVGTPVKVLWLLTRGRFRRAERRAFRYAD